MTRDSKALQQSITELIRQQKLPVAFDNTVSRVYQPLAAYIADAVSHHSKPLFVSINGSQGSGKSTLTLFLKSILEKGYGIPVAAVSIDDFYLTRKERMTLATTIHPLLKTRGVPGTHDVALMQDIFGRLLEGRNARLPVFNKAMDDRSDTSRQQQPVELILFEGWCNNAEAQPESELNEPVNELEKTQDADGRWRHFVNNKIIEYQQKIFRYTDKSIMLKAPSFASVYNWRQKQEDKLAESLLSTADKKHLMNREQLCRFIEHYERITRNNLKVLPDKVDVLLPLDEEQQITDLHFSEGEYQV